MAVRPDDLTRLQGKWRIVNIAEEGVGNPPRPGSGWEVEVRGTTITMPHRTVLREKQRAWINRVCDLSIDEGKNPKELTLAVGGKTVARGIYLFVPPDNNPGPGHIDLLIAASPDTRPTRFRATGEGGYEFGLVRVPDGIAGTPPAPRVEEARAALNDLRKQVDRLKGRKGIDPDIEREVHQLGDRVTVVRSLLGGTDPPTAPSVSSAELAKLRQAQAVVERARVQLEVAQVQLMEARALYAAAQAEAELAEKKLTRGTQPAAGSKQYLILLRPVVGREEMTARALGGNETIHDLLAGAGVKETEKTTVRVWVVRPTAGSPAPEVLSVDWEGISRRGEATTNYQIIDGDTVVIQYLPKP